MPSRDQAGDDGRVDEDDQEDVAEGMEAEEGDFVNLEVAFSYRASSSGKSLKVKSKNAHIYLAFYLPGGIRLRTLRLFHLPSPQHSSWISQPSVLTFFSRLGGASRNRSHHENATSTVS